MTGAVSKQFFQARNLPLQGKNCLLELCHFLIGATFSQFCKLRFFLVILSISLCLFQLFL